MDLAFDSKNYNRPNKNVSTVIGNFSSFHISTKLNIFLGRLELRDELKLADRLEHPRTLVVIPAQIPADFNTILNPPSTWLTSAPVGVDKWGSICPLKCLVGRG